MKKMTPHWFVLDKETERTIAICNNKADADWIAENYPTECIVRVAIY